MVRLPIANAINCFVISDHRIALYNTKNLCIPKDFRITFNHSEDLCVVENIRMFVNFSTHFCGSRNLGGPVYLSCYLSTAPYGSIIEYSSEYLCILADARIAINDSFFMYKACSCLTKVLVKLYESPID